MGEPGAGPDAASLSPEQVAMEVVTLREHPDLYDAHAPGYAAVNARMNELDRRLRAGGAPTGEPGTPDPAESPLEATNRRAAEASALELRGPAGQEVEADAQVALRLLTVTHDIPPTELPTFLTEAFAAQGRAGMDAEARLTERDEVLVAAFGEHADMWIDRAASVLLDLPPRLRAYVHQYGMLQDPWIWQRAAERWKQTHQ